MATGIQNPITIDYLSDAHNENLVLVDVAFNLWYVWECPTDTVDIAALPAPFNGLPPAVTDLEKEQYIINTPPNNIIPPVIAGGNIVGILLKVTDNGTWTGTMPITFTYQWQSNGIDIAGETNDEYTIVLSDSGQQITCVVTATNISGSTSAISNDITVL
jgi:hypothetical protein